MAPHQLQQPQAGLAGGMQPPYLPPGQLTGMHAQQGGGMPGAAAGLPGVPMPASQLNGGMPGLPAVMPAAGATHGMPGGGMPGGVQLPALGMMDLPGGLLAGYPGGGGMPGIGLAGGLDLPMEGAGVMPGGRPTLQAGSMRPSTSAGECSDGGGGSGGGGSKQKKTLKQQEANKIAQQR